MFRSLFPKLSALFSPDRFADWPEVADSTPPLVDLAARRIGPLVFGAPMDDARLLGRPDRYELIHPDTVQLLYARSGLLLEFDKQGGLDYAAYLISPDSHDPDHPALRHTRPQFAEGVTLGPKSTEADVRRLFGELRSEDRDADETLLLFERDGLSVECELFPAPRGTLKRLNVFPA